MVSVQCRVPEKPEMGCITIPKRYEREIFLLKQLTWHYVIYDPTLVTQQYGQREIIRKLFAIFQEAAAASKNHTIFPPAIRHELGAAGENHELVTRIVADFISGMSERQAIRMHRTLTGH
jgi:dGTPase